MRAFRTGLIEFLLLGVLGVVVGFGVNAARSRGAIKPGKNYFALLPAKLDTKKSSDVAMPVQPISSLDASGKSAHNTTEPEANAEVSGGKAQALENPYRVISFEEVVEVFNDPETESGLNVFVDARNDEEFEEGHIPGAVQFFPYEADRFIDDVLERTNGVLRVIVYCNGGECSDSKFAYRELLEAGVPDDALFLFATGWESWTENKMPVASGRGEE